MLKIKRKAGDTILAGDLVVHVVSVSPNECELEIHGVFDQVNIISNESIKISPEGMVCQSSAE